MITNCILPNPLVVFQNENIIHLMVKSGCHKALGDIG